MPDQPNHKEFGGATQEAQKTVTDLYDARYGGHKESEHPSAAPKAPSVKPSPFGPLTGGK